MMNNFRRIWTLLAFIIVGVSSGFTQFSWQVDLLTPMPEPVSNNAVCGAKRFGADQVYSFAGIDSTKLYSGIHLKSFRYDISTQSWFVLPPLPDTLGKIAAGASTIGDVIYIVGGYHVFSNGNEVSSRRIHRFHIPGDTFLTDGADIPVPIDDHVQAVYNDSLIFVVTGWSNSTNVPNVQIYDPVNDLWLVGTSVPDNNNYKVFGASGAILGNTIYYQGGARIGANFPGSLQFVKGIIDPSDPTQITWSDELPPNPKVGYRMASTALIDRVFWFGGSEQTYNYDGIAYNGSGGVEPSDRISSYEPDTDTWSESTFDLPMDLRGAASATGGFLQIWLAGGMGEGQKVSDQTIRIYAPILDAVDEIDGGGEDGYSLFPNPAVDELTVLFTKLEAGRNVRVIDLDGQIIAAYHGVGSSLKLDLSTYPGGVFLLEVQAAAGISNKRFVIVR